MFAEWVCLHPDPTYSQTFPHSEGLGTRFLPESPPLGLIGKARMLFSRLEDGTAHPILLM